MENRYIIVNLATTSYGQPDCNVTKGKVMYVEAELGEFSEDYVIVAENNGSGVVLVEGSASGRIHLKPRGDSRGLVFGGTFATTSDGRFPYDHPIHIHDAI